MKRFRLTIAWLVGALGIAVVSFGGPEGTFTAPRIADHEVVQTHYAMSLAAAFVAFAGFYSLLALRPVILPRRGLALCHFVLMGLGATLIVSPRAMIGPGGLGWTTSDPGAAFTLLNRTSLAGYLLTLAGLAVFVALLAEGLTTRLRRQWKTAT